MNLSEIHGPVRVMVLLLTLAASMGVASCSRDGGEGEDGDALDTEADDREDASDPLPEDEGDGDALVYPDAGVECMSGEPTPGTTAALLFDARGFAEGVTGGARGCLYHVTTLDDSGAGSLREALDSPEPLWIVFDLSGTITLDSELITQSDKTIDGRGRRIEIVGGGLIIEDAPIGDIVVENIIFREGLDAGDAITIYGGVSMIWVDHCTFGPWGDGQIDVTEASTDVTVSWCLFRDHELVMLIGAGPESTGDTVIRVTVHHNWFDGTDERHPRLRYGKAHVYNNLYVNWLYYGIGSSQLGQVASEGNIFDAGDNKDAIITRVGSDPEDGLVRSSGEWLLGGAVALENRPDEVFLPADYYESAVDTADAALRSAIESQAGWRDIPRP